WTTKLWFTTWRVRRRIVSTKARPWSGSDAMDAPPPPGCAFTHNQIEDFDRYRLRLAGSQTAGTFSFGRSRTQRDFSVAPAVGIQVCADRFGLAGNSIHHCADRRSGGQLCDAGRGLHLDSVLSGFQL